MNRFSTQKQTELALQEELDMGRSSLSGASREVTELSVPLAANTPRSRPVPHQQDATAVGVAQRAWSVSSVLHWEAATRVQLPKKPTKLFRDRAGFGNKEVLKWKNFSTLIFQLWRKIIFAASQKTPNKPTHVNSNKIFNHAKLQCAGSFKRQDHSGVMVVVRELSRSGS